MFALVFIGFLVTFFSFISDTSSSLAPQSSYCAVSREHTACRFTKPNQQGTCSDVKKRGLSAAEQSKILDAHNAKRRLIAKGQQRGQPPASNMAKLVWDPEAAAIAQLWVDQCTFEHDTSRDTVKGGTINNGQNLFISFGSPSLDIDQAVNSWYNEVTSFPSSGVSSYRFASDTGHYTQMVWAKTTRLGCGYTYYGTRHLLACNYAPGGNVQGAPVYQTGTACSACPTDMKECDNGLCSAASRMNGDSPTSTEVPSAGEEVSVESSTRAEPENGSSTTTVANEGCSTTTTRRRRILG